MYKLVILTSIFFCIQSLYSQNQESNYYHWPVQGQRLITGSFGEFRAYSFHVGTDFTTEGKIGIPILALSNGKLKKIQSFRYGIGNAILIQQEDGFTSRYGHMNHFAEKILSALKNETIKDKIQKRIDFEYETNSEESINIQKGEIIGYSGQTGIGPPHLHVELFKGDMYYNLADFLDLKNIDNYLNIESIMLTPENQDSFINGRQEKMEWKVSKGRDGKYYPVSTNPIKIKGMVSVSIKAHESAGRGSRLGIRKINVFLDKKNLQELNMGSIYYPHLNRSCFVLDNYESNIRGRPFKYFTYIREDSIIGNFKFPKKGSGIINYLDLLEDKDSELEILVEGLTKKQISLILRLQKDKTEYPPVSLVIPANNLTRDTSLEIVNQDLSFRVLFPKNSIFTTGYISAVENTSISVKKEGILQLSQVYSVYPDFREFDLGYEMFLKVDKEINLFPEKSSVFLVSNKGEILKYLSFEYESKTGLYKGKLKLTGNFVVLEDSVSPTVQVQNLKNKQEIDSTKTIILKAKDLGTGVSEKGMNALIDDKEVWLDYDPDLGSWEIFGPEFIFEKGEHLLTVQATDRAGNKSEKLELQFKRK